MSSHKGGGGGRERTGKSSCQSQSGSQSMASNQSHAGKSQSGGQSATGNQSSHTGKSEAAVNGNKHQATADQIYWASLSSDKSGIDSEMAKKIAEISDMTGRTVDDTWMALHDCDNDIPRAVDLLLDGQDEQNEWQDVCKKKKAGTGKSGSGQPDGTLGEEGSLRHRGSNNAESNFHDTLGGAGDDSSSSRRSKVAPRFSRGRGKSVGGVSHPSEERPAQGFSANSARSQDRRRGRGRGSSMGGAPRNQPRVGGFQANTGITHIETWNTESFSSQIDSSSTLPPVGSWGDTVEELERAEAASNAAKVQINGSSNSGASHSSDGNAVGGSGRRSVESSRSSQVGVGAQRPVGSRGQDSRRGVPGLAPGAPQSASLPTTSISGGRAPGGTSLMGLLNAGVSSSSLGTTADGGPSAWSSVSHGSSASHSASQGGFDLSKLFSIGSSSMMPGGMPASGSGNTVYGNIIDPHHHHQQQQHHHQQHQQQQLQQQRQRLHQSSLAAAENTGAYSQFAKEATEVIKNAVGIGNNSSIGNNANSSSGTSSHGLLEHQLQGAESAAVNQRHATQSEVRLEQQQQQQQRVASVMGSKLPSASAEMSSSSLLKDGTTAGAAGSAREPGQQQQFTGGWDPTARNSVPLGFSGSVNDNLQSALGQYPGMRSGFGHQSAGPSLNHILPGAANQPAPIGPPMTIRLTLEDLGISSSSVQSTKITSAPQSIHNYDAVNQSSFTQLSYSQSGSSRQAENVPASTAAVPIGYRSTQGMVAPPVLSQQNAASSTQTSQIPAAVDGATQQKSVYDMANHARGTTMEPAESFSGVASTSVPSLSYNNASMFPSMKVDRSMGQYFDGLTGYSSVGGVYGVNQHMYSAGGMMQNPVSGGMMVGDGAVVGAYLSADGSLVGSDAYHGVYGMGAEYQTTVSRASDKMATTLGNTLSRLTLSDTSTGTLQQLQQTNYSVGSANKANAQVTSSSAVNPTSTASSSTVSSSTIGTSQPQDKSSPSTTTVSGTLAGTTAGSTQHTAAAAAMAAAVPLGAAPVYNQNYFIGQPPGFQQMPAAPAAAAYGRYAPTQQPLTYSFEDTQQLLQQQQQALSMTGAPAGFYDLPFTQHQTGLPLSANSASFSTTVDGQSMPTLPPFPPAGVISSTVGGGDLKMGGMDPLMSGLVPAPGLHQPTPVNQMYGTALQQATANQQQPYGSALQQQTAVNQQQQQQQQQTYSMLPPGYSYYYPNTAGVMPMGSYYTPMIPMNNVPVTLMPGVQSDTVVAAAGAVGGGAPVSNSQYQKSVLYGSSTYRGPGGDDYMRNHVGNHRPTSMGVNANITGMPMTSYEADSSFQMNSASYMDRGNAQGILQKISAGNSGNMGGSRGAYNPATAPSWSAK